MKPAEIVMKASVIMGLLVMTGCSSKLDSEMKKAEERQKVYNSPAFKAQQKAIMDAQRKGASEAMMNWRFPDAAPSKKAKATENNK